MLWPVVKQHKAKWVPTDCLHAAQEMLRQLWTAAYPGEPCDALKTERWKDMGWQVRGLPCGLLVLQA